MSDYERFYSTPFYRTILFLVGFLASFLWLAISSRNNADVQFWAVGLYALMALALVGLTIWLHVLRPRLKNKGSGATAEADVWPWGDANRARGARWLALGLVTLGFGVGIATFVYKEWIRFLGKRFFLDVNTTEKVLLTFLFLLGVVMGAYVVRNWSKKQDEFNSSVTTALGAAFLTAVLGRAQGSDITVNIAHYGLGFVISLAVNLIASSALSARYSSTQSLTARGLLDLLYGSERAEAIDRYFEKNFESDPNSAKQLLVQTLTQYRDRVLGEYATKMEENRLRRRTGGSPPSDQKVYQLLSIENDPASPVSSPDLAPADDNRLYRVKLKLIENSGILKEMFRMGIAVRVADNLTYVVTPGEYRRSFPFYGSVAGLALIMRKTIVMHRDTDTKFRSESYRDGLTPRQINHSRGLDVIDYLSYVTVPIASSYSNQGELALGIINVDTRLFVMSESERDEVYEDADRDDPNIIYAQLTPGQLKAWAARLYDQDDRAIKYLEDMRAIVVPVIQLYAKTLQGSS